MQVDELGAWLRLLLMPGVGRVQARQLLAAAGLPQAVFELPPSSLEAIGLARVWPALRDEAAELPGQLQTTVAWLDGGADRFVFVLGDPG